MDWKNLEPTWKRCATLDTVEKLPVKYTHS